MSDLLQHECGIALLRLKKPLQYYIDTYGTAFYGLNKMYLLMEKQRCLFVPRLMMHAII